MERDTIISSSRRYKRLFVFLFYLVPVSYLFVWIFAPYFPEAWINKHGFEMARGITPMIQVLGFVISMLGGAVVMYGTRVMIDLFTEYERGVVFSEITVACFRRLSRTIIIWVIVGFITEPLMTLVLTMYNGQGNRSVALSLESADLTALVIGGTLSVISRVMEDGRKLQEEMALTV